VVCFEVRRVAGGASSAILPSHLLLLITCFYVLCMLTLSPAAHYILLNLSPLSVSARGIAEMSSSH
jgi:hypothetical protein